jgi:hypothetical protein
MNAALYVSRVSSLIAPSARTRPPVIADVSRSYAPSRDSGDRGASPNTARVSSNA